jgi:hypothetical protein
VGLEKSNTRRLNPSKLLILGAIVIFFSFSVSGAVSEGLIAHYPLNEESGNIAEDIEGNEDGNHRNFNGGELGENGVYSKSYELDGEDEYIDITSNSISLSDFTISAWIKGSGPVLGSGKQEGWPRYWKFGSSGFYLAPVSGDDRPVYSVGIENLDKEKWHHIVVKRSGSSIYTYVDGVPSNSKSSFPEDNIVTYNDWGQFIGKLKDDKGQYTTEEFFKGYLDNIKIYNRDLTYSEIRELYRNADLNPKVDTFKLNSSDVEIGDSVKVLANASDENITSVDLEVLEDGNELDLSESNQSGIFVSEGFRADESYTKYNYSANFTDNSSQSTYVSNTFLTLGSPVRGGQKSFSTPRNTVRGGESIFATGFGGAIQLNASEVEPGESIKVSGTVYNDTNKVDGSVDLNSTGITNNLSFDFSSGKFSKTLKAGDNYGKYNLTSYVTSSGESFNISKEFEIKNSAPRITRAYPNGTNVNPDNVKISINASDKSDLNISLFDVTGATPSKMDEFKGKKQAETGLNNVQEDKKYTWRANITDGFSNVSRDFNFTTHSIEITWDHEGGKRLEGFRIYSNASGNWTEIKEVGKGKREAKVFNKGLETGEQASYRVRAYNNAGESPPAEATVTPELGGDP